MKAFVASLRMKSLISLPKIFAICVALTMTFWSLKSKSTTVLLYSNFIISISQDFLTVGK